MGGFARAFLRPAIVFMLVAAIVALLIVTWGVVLAVGFIVRPSLPVWLGIVAAAAILSEIALWIGTAVAGIALFQKVRDRLRLRSRRA